MNYGDLKRIQLLCEQLHEDVGRVLALASKRDSERLASAYDAASEISELVGREADAWDRMAEEAEIKRMEEIAEENAYHDHRKGDFDDVPF